ncbi:MAG: serine/threonine protein kinase [Ahniella sp.]|nr:serine/threonine protein kinase [Ahniella sp.]
MDQGHWQKLRKLLDQALDLEAAKRAEFAAQVDDEELRADLVRMLARHDHTTPLDRPAAMLAAEAIVPPSERDWDREQIGRRVGAFVLDELLGAGGMGTVYRAHRVDGHLQQTVAVKLVLSAHPGLRERFRKEQQIVAGLRHPNIAQLIDAGESEDGIPFLAMEYVEGVSITDYCRDRLPDAGGRVRLMLRVASALAHAHRNLVIHRDIKPSNIMVTDDGLPMLLDFGIAKLVGEDRFSPVTAQRLGPMTPAYAAPEQFRGGAISVATDVYQFGALLYRILTGRLPYSADPHDPIGWGRAVLEEEPVTLGRAMADVRRDQDTDAAREAVRTLGRDINRDLDAILRTALAKEPGRRYSSIDAMVADLEAFLDGRPVQARHGDRWYHLTRFVRRHWVSTLAGSVAVLGLLSLTVVSWRLAERARHESERSALTVRFLNEVMQSLDPVDGLGHRSSAEDVLKHALSRFESEFANHPDLRAPLMISLATTFANMGQPKEAYELFRDALPDYRVPDVDPIQRAAALERAAFAAYRNGRGEEARAWSAEAERLAKGDSDLSWRVRDGNAANRWALQREAGQRKAALDVAQDALAQARVAPERIRDALTQRALHRSGVSLAEAGDLVQAEANLRESLALARKLYGEDRYLTLRARSSLAWFLTIKGEPDRALVEFNAVCGRLREQLGDFAFDYGSCLYNRGNAYVATGRHEKAITTYRETANILLRRRGERHLERRLGLAECSVAATPARAIRSGARDLGRGRICLVDHACE